MSFPLIFSPFSIAYRSKNAYYTKPVLMGIINITPDSFYDGGMSVGMNGGIKNAVEKESNNASFSPSPNNYLKKIEQLLKEGADIIDLGGESTRPGAKAISDLEEISRVIPVLEKAKKEFPEAIFSIDTSKVAVAKACVDLGIDMLNDISAGDHSRNEMLKLAVKHQMPIILMHKQGIPSSMQNDPVYGNVVEEIRDYLNNKVELLLEMGLADNKIILDPGIGFGKTVSHNLQIIKHCRDFGIRSTSRNFSKSLPVLIGVSMKSVIGHITGEPTHNRLAGSLGLELAALSQGASVFRVHHVKATQNAMDAYMQIAYDMNDNQFNE